MIDPLNNPDFRSCLSRYVLCEREVCSVCHGNKYILNLVCPHCQGRGYVIKVIRDVEESSSDTLQDNIHLNME